MSTSQLATDSKFSLYPELVPKPLWGLSGANLLSRKAWESIRQSELEKAHRCCAVCLSTDSRLICHEQWAYDDENGTATLRGFEIHCKKCDLVTHMGRARAHGMGEEAIAQFCAINHTLPDQAKETYRKAFSLWQLRNQKNWTLRVAEIILQQYPELSLLQGYNSKIESTE